MKKRAKNKKRNGEIRQRKGKKARGDDRPTNDHKILKQTIYLADLEIEVHVKTAYKLGNKRAW